MATRKRLGAVEPAATTETDLYNSPTTVTDVVISAIHVCNKGVATTFRISDSAEGSATVDADYSFYDAPIAANETIILQVGMTIEKDWDIRVYAGTADVTFKAYGQENT